MVSKNFKGQVKISDVQEAFNEIVNRTNEMLEFYNSSEGVKDIDYTKGSPTLAPSGYTLTVGGLKQAMKLADKCVVGAKPIKIGKNQVKLTSGILVTKDKICRLKDEILNKPAGNFNLRTLYYNPITETYQWEDTYNTTEVDAEGNPVSVEAYKICDIDFSSSSKTAGVTAGCQNEDVNGTFKITSQSRWVKPVAEQTPTDNVINNTDKPLFVSAMEATGYEGNPKTTITFLGNEVSYTQGCGHRQLDTWTPINFFFLPRGVTNPYKVTPANRDFTHKFEVITTKSLKDS